ncbi:hypothetical protein LY76DRAFT_156900 [Colletotrichum caudatum]|nr:hypothetical protein LY76DRAFT_156900 [Colletotrichum caudatum]
MEDDGEGRNRLVMLLGSGTRAKTESGPRSTPTGRPGDAIPAIIPHWPRIGTNSSDRWAEAGGSVCLLGSYRSQKRTQDASHRKQTIKQDRFGQHQRLKPKKQTPDDLAVRSSRSWKGKKNPPKKRQGKQSENSNEIEQAFLSRRRKPTPGWGGGQVSTRETDRRACPLPLNFSSTAAPMNLCGWTGSRQDPSRTLREQKGGGGNNCWLRGHGTSNHRGWSRRRRPTTS